MSSIKDTKKLFKEITNRNPNYPNINNIYQIYERIKAYYSENMKSITDMQLKQKISSIKQKIKIYPDDENIYIELISVMIKVNGKIFRYKPRETQIIAVLFFLFKQKNSGLIQEILTGEGKTIIISFLAVIKAFQGKKVDILTSSTVLAERDANEMRNFYGYFGLSVDFCNKDFHETFRNTYLEDNRERQECFGCYKADIVYGDPLSFEGDILRTNFMSLVGRGTKRNFDCIIIDEIDNICIDNIKNITELLDNFHGYKFLEYIYLFIYKQLVKIDEDIKKEVQYDEIKYEISVLVKKQQIIEELNKKAQKEFGNLYLLSERKNIFLPEHLSGFINCRIKKWCESAYDAMYIYKENREYIISNDETYGFKTIKPVDFSNTGVIQENSVWTGLHQFLQIKEGLRLTEESLNSCYMSNFTFFKKYISKNENNIYGLTGTVGSAKTQEALKILYKVNLLFIPTFKEYKLKIYPPIIEKDINEYDKILINNIKDIAINQGRAVLVIFKYISQVSEMYHKLIQNNIPQQKIIQYSRNDIDNEKSFLKNEIQPGSIILSTNLSGRGTDIKISNELEQRNGLHVILTFLPFSERIERQAFGRAGRKGENGSGQLIINEQENYEELLKKRKIKEENEFNYLIKVYKRKIDLFQELFEEFSDFLNEIRERKNVETSMILDIKERWGLFLVENDLEKIEKDYKDESSLIINEKLFEETKNNFKIFMNMLKKNIKSGYKYINPLLLCKTFIKDKCDEAIIKSPVLCLGAYSFRSLYKLDKKMNNCQKDALNDFIILEENCNILLNQIKTYKKMMNELCVIENSDLDLQTRQKIRFLEELLDIIRNNKNTLQYAVNNPIGKKYELIPRIITLKEINYHRDYFDDILDYFKDYGMCLYDFHTEESKDECSIF